MLVCCRAARLLFARAHSPMALSKPSARPTTRRRPGASPSQETSATANSGSAAFTDTHSHSSAQSWNRYSARGQSAGTTIESEVPLAPPSRGATHAAPWQSRGASSAAVVVVVYLVASECWG